MLRFACQLLVFVWCGVVGLSSCQPEKKPPVVPPAAVLQTQRTLFPRADSLHWKREPSGFYEAHFYVGGLHHKLRIGADGKWRETEQDVARTALPVPVQDTLQHVLDVPPRTSRIRSVSIVTYADGRTEYEAHVRIDKKWRKRYYDAKGHLLREEKAKHG